MTVVAIEQTKEPRWGAFLSKNAKAVTATLTPAIALGTSLGAMLPAEKAVPITAGVAVVTGLLTWLTANIDKMVAIANTGEAVAEDLLNRDL